MELIRITEFRIGRGHDGPARVGTYIMGDTSVETPLFAGSGNSKIDILQYRTLERDQVLSSPNLVALPFGLDPDALDEVNLGESDSLLLPSLISFSYVDDNAASLLLHLQLEFIHKIKNKIDPSRLILRVPENLDDEVFKSIIPDFHSLGIRAAAFVFNGQLGAPDSSSISLRSVLPTSWLTVALGRITPSTIPLLYYAGFDIIDCGHASESATQGLRLWRLDSERIEPKQTHRFCSCTACSSLSDVDDETTLKDTIRNHNMNLYAEILSESVHAMKNGNLRWLVESMTHASPNHASLLRQLDKEVYSFFGEFTPTTGSGTVPLIGPESYNSPVVRRYRERLEERYIPPSGKRIILLLPCSARKPYSDSKSHRRFLETIDGALGRKSNTIAQAILTSPLGLVPRELERVFPAANYDIPVTGDWDTEETLIGADALVAYLNKFDEDCTVIAHVSGGYLGIVKAAESRISQTIIYTTAESPATSRDSLQSLFETLSDLREVMDLKESPQRQLEEIVRATADFQFGRGAGEKLVPEDAKLGGKPYRQIVCRIGKDQVCSFIADSGTISLTMEGARLLAPLERYWVRLETSDVKGGSIFAVGVNEADSAISPGDEVIVIDKEDNVVAVGKSEMSGREMCELNRGRAVSLRHKKEGGK